MVRKEEVDLPREGGSYGGEEGEGQGKWATAKQQGFERLFSSCHF